MGGAGGPPAPVGDPPTGTAASNVAKSPCPLARTVAPVPSGESPDGTGGSPVLPANYFQTRSAGNNKPRCALLSWKSASGSRLPQHIVNIIPRRSAALLM